MSSGWTTTPASPCYGKLLQWGCHLDAALQLQLPSAAHGLHSQSLWVLIGLVCCLWSMPVYRFSWGTLAFSPPMQLPFFWLFLGRDWESLAMSLEELLAVHSSNKLVKGQFHPKFWLQCRVRPISKMYQGFGKIIQHPLASCCRCPSKNLNSCWLVNGAYLLVRAFVSWSLSLHSCPN